MLTGESWCQECACLTNHDTRMHEAALAEQSKCVDCGHELGDDDPETRYCRACLADRAEYRAEQARESLAKSLNRGEGF